jgi:hypothetical protein
MSNQPPSNMPEMRRENPKSNPPARKSRDEYVYVPLDDDTSTPRQDNRGGWRGCLMGLGGTLGCLLVVGLILGATILVTGATVGSMINNITSPFASLWENSGFNTPPRNVYIPPVERVQQLSEISTVKYSYSQMILSEVDMPDLLSRLYGNSLVLVAVGHVRAGIDISQITDEDISYDESDDVLTLRLPAPVLQECFLNDSETYVAERRSAAFAPDAPQLDTESRRYAVRVFRDRALEEGILQEAAQEAEQVVSEFLQIVQDDTEIRVITAPADPDAPLPDTCR